MRGSELLRLVGLNINQNKFKTIMTSIGIVVGAATIVLVIGIGRGGQMDVAEQFAELNAGAIDVTYDYAGEEEASGGGSFMDGVGQMFGNIGNMFGGFFGGGGSAPGGNSSSGDGGSGDAGGSSGGGDMSGFSGGGPGGDASGDTDASSGTDGSGNSGTDFSGGGPGGNAPGGDFSGEMPDAGGGNSDGDSADAGTGNGGGADSGNSGGPGGQQGSAGGQEGRENEASSDGASGSGAEGDAQPDNGNNPGGSGMENGAADSGSNAGTDGNGSGSDAGTDGNGSDSDAGTDENGSAFDAGTDENSSEDGSEDETSAVSDRLNQEDIILTQDDVEDIERYVSGISGATISYSTRGSVEGADLTSAQTYTVAGVKENYAELSKLTLSAGDFLTEEDDELKERVCVLGATAAEELFGDSEEIEGSTIYIEDRTYTVMGVLNQSSTVSAGISPDTTIFIPYETGIKYITGESISPTLTVIAEDVNVLDSVISDVRTVLEENYDNAEFTFEDSGSKMEAAQSSNRTLTMLLSAMAAIVFLVGGIGIMNVLFVSVKERTNEIGILKAIGTSRTDILIEFLVESAAISCIGGVLGVAISFGVIPIVEKFDVRVEVTTYACLAALGFAVLTGTVFGIYPAWKASRLEPVEALNAE